MRVAINQKHLSLNKRLANEANKLIRGFNYKNYVKVENIDDILLKRDITIENKKRILIKKLHKAIVTTFSIDKNRLNKKTFDSLKKRLHKIRKIILKLRSINYYLETIFLEELRFSKIKIKDRSSKLNQQTALARNELEALEYAAYKLIEEVITLDKKVLSEYIIKEEKVISKEKIEIKELDLILRKESELLEHMEAKLPPPKAATINLVKEPIFTHWVARLFALLSYLENLYAKEAKVFVKLKKNKKLRAKISKKIIHLIKEKSKLLKIMEEKAISMKKFGLGRELKKELHNFAATMSI
mgnify:FL=1